MRPPEWVRRTLPYRVARRLFHTVRRAVRPTVSDRSEQYDRELGEVIRRTLRPDSTAVDVGANLGSILAAIVAAAPAGQHHAFEPIPALAGDLSRRFPGVQIHEVALADAPGRSTFYHVLNGEAESGLRRTSQHTADPQVAEIQVEVRRLDDVIPPATQVAFLKIDAEGADPVVLRGGRELLSRCRLVVVFEAGQQICSHFGVTGEDIWSYFESLGYRLTTMSRWLKGRPPWSHRQFLRVWQRGSEWNFLAHYEGLPKIGSDVTRTPAALPRPDGG